MVSFVISNHRRYWLSWLGLLFSRLQRLFNYFAFKYLDFLHSRWRVFHWCAIRTKLDIYDFINILVCYENLRSFFCSCWFHLFLFYIELNSGICVFITDFGGRNLPSREEWYVLLAACFASTHLCIYHISWFTIMFTFYRICLQRNTLCN